jgi:hypothetical protein
MDDQPGNTESKSPVDRHSAASPSRGKTAIVTHQFWLLEILYFGGNRRESLPVRIANRAGRREGASVISSVSIASGWGRAPSHPGALTSISHVTGVARHVFHIGNNFQSLETFLMQIDVAGVKVTIV